MILQVSPNIIDQLSENKLFIAIIAAIVGAILTKLVPAAWGGLKSFLRWSGRLVGGRFAYKSFEKLYLDWIVTEHQELKLTGIVSSDDVKKPKLEQVFVSLALSRDSVDFTIQANVPYIPDELINFKELFRLTSLQRSLDRAGSEGTNLRMATEELKAMKASYRRDKIRHLLLRKTPRPNEKVIVEVWLDNWAPVVSGAMESSQLSYILNHGQRVAVLGSPGAGKTTILQYLALALAKARAGDKRLCDRGKIQRNLGIVDWRLPIFIRLSSVASMLAKARQTEIKPTSLLDILPLIMPADLQNEKIGKHYILGKVKAGKCIFLFDGLDEVPTDDEFKDVVQAVESLVVSYPLNKFIVTSRMAGWRGGVRGDFSVFFVKDFSDDQINKFVDIWYAAVEQNAVIGRLEDEGEGARVARERRMRARSDDLKLTLKENIGIRRLAANPMLLSIIAVVHRSLAALPKERSKLYSQCSRILLEQWDISRGVRVDDTNLKLEQKEAIMRRLAIAFHAGEIGDSGGGREANRINVVSVIAELLPSLGRLAEDADHLLQRLIDRSGIIVERRRGVLSFVHLTFQEYFSAQYLSIGERIEHRNFLSTSARIYSDWWHEVSLLYSGLISDASSFIESVISEGEDDESIFLRRTRLAGLCVGEAVEVRRIDLRAMVHEKLLQVRLSTRLAKLVGRNRPEIGAYLVRWAYSSNWFSHSALLVLEDFTFRHEVRRGRIIEELKEALILQEVGVRRAIVDGISTSQIGIGEETVLELASSLIEDSDLGVRWSAIKLVLGYPSLGERLKLNRHSLEETLIEALRSSPDDIGAMIDDSANHAGHFFANNISFARLEEWLFDDDDLRQSLALMIVSCLSDYNFQRLSDNIAAEYGPSSVVALLGSLSVRSRVVQDNVLPQIEAGVFVNDDESKEELNQKFGALEVLFKMVNSGAIKMISSKSLVLSLCKLGKLGVAIWALIDYEYGSALSNEAICIELDDVTVMELLGYLRDGAPVVRRLVVFILCRMVVRESIRGKVVNSLLDATRDGNSSVRASALLSLVRFANEEYSDQCHDRAMRMSGDRSGQVRLAAVILRVAACELKHTDDIESIIAAALEIKYNRHLFRDIFMPWRRGRPELSQYIKYMLMIAEKIRSLDIFKRCFEELFGPVSRNEDYRMQQDFYYLKDLKKSVLELPKEATSQFLVERVRGGGYQRVVALVLLFNIRGNEGWPQIRPLVVAALRDSLDTLRLSMLAQLHSFAVGLSKDEVADLVCPSLEDNNDSIREEAWRILEKIGYVEGSNLDKDRPAKTLRSTFYSSTGYPRYLLNLRRRSHPAPAASRAPSRPGSSSSGSI
jgi:energy-coupling factor transporter ATP-binding protein EcfA2